MPEETAESSTETTSSQETSQETSTQQEPDVEELKKALAKANSEAKDYRLKYRSTEKELNDIRQSSMSDAEKVAAEAEARGRSAATAEFGTRLARTEFDAAAARINKDFKTEDVMEFVNLSALVDEDGNPDKAKIKLAAERLIRPAEAGAPSYDGGSRTPAAGKGDMNSIIRKAAGFGG